MCMTLDGLRDSVHDENEVDASLMNSNRAMKWF